MFSCSARNGQRRARSGSRLHGSPAPLASPLRPRAAPPVACLLLSRLSFTFFRRRNYADTVHEHTALNSNCTLFIYLVPPYIAVRTP